MGLSFGPKAKAPGQIQSMKTNSLRISPAAAGVFLAALSLVAPTAGCRKAPRPDNLILVTLDTQRQDYLGAYSPGKARTPNFDEIAGQSLLFKNAYCVIPITLPSHASIFFSEPPDAVKNYNNGQIISKKRSRPSFVNLFKKEGFLTAAFVSLGVLGSDFGLEEAFDLYVGRFPEDRWYLSAGEVNQRVLPWLEQNRDRKFFLWVHYSDPHDPYSPPDDPADTRLFLNGKLIHETCLNKYTLNTVNLDLKPGKNELRFEMLNEEQSNPDQFMARLDKLETVNPADGKEVRTDLVRGWYFRRSDSIFFLKTGSLAEINNTAGLKQVRFTFRGKPLFSVQGTRNKYRQEVEYMDSEIGKLWAKLRQLGLAERTAVVMAGDHGEGLGEYLNSFGDPHIGHIHFLYEVYMRVPLTLYLPGYSRAGKTEETPVTLLDIAPTISGIMGFGRLPSFKGRSLLSLKEKRGPSIYQQTWRPEAVWNKFGLLVFPWHMILTPETQKYELFDLSRDRDERTDLFGGPDLPQEVESLKQTLASFAREALRDKEDIQVDQKAREMLRSLGYIK